MSRHRNSDRFKDDDFDITILEESTDRDYIERRETELIIEMDTFHNGLNNSFNGKGLQEGFTTKNFIFSERSKSKMAKSAKRRAQEEGFEVRSKRSADNWKNPEYAKRQSEVRKGKRLRPPKLSDEQVLEIRERFKRETTMLMQEVADFNERAKKRGWKQKNIEGHFSQKYAEEYGVSKTLLRDIVQWKTRTEIYPRLKSKHQVDTKSSTV